MSFLAEKEDQPSAIVLDIRIDDCDGLELLTDIKEIPPDLPIILYTACDSYSASPLLPIIAL